MSEWISVEKQLPEPCRLVLVFTPEVKGHKIIMAYLRLFDSGAPWWYEANTTDHITARISHWMPLPKYPTEK